MHLFALLDFGIKPKLEKEGPYQILIAKIKIILNVAQFVLQHGDPQLYGEPQKCT
jgi:hypothetical protein